MQPAPPREPVLPTERVAASVIPRPVGRAYPDFVGDVFRSDGIRLRDPQGECALSRPIRAERKPIFGSRQISAKAAPNGASKIHKNFDFDGNNPSGLAIRSERRDTRSQLRRELWQNFRSAYLDRCDCRPTARICRGYRGKRRRCSFISQGTPANPKDEKG